MRPQNSSRSIVTAGPRRDRARQPVGLEDPLIREVVNREDARHAAEHRMRRVERVLQVDRREPGLPVVRVDTTAVRPAARRTRARRAPGTRNGAGCRDSRRCRRRTSSSRSNNAGTSTRIARAPSSGDVVEGHVLGLAADGQRKAIDERAGRPRRGTAAAPGSTSQPRRASAGGSAPSTSASPPVLANGSASEPMIEHRRRTVGTGTGMSAGLSTIARVTERPPRAPRAEPREIVELKQLKARAARAGDAVDMQIALVEMQRRVQARVPLPWIQADPSWLAAQQAAGRPVVRFGDIPLEWTRLPADASGRPPTSCSATRRSSAPNTQQIVALGRDGNALEPLVTQLVPRHVRRRRRRADSNARRQDRPPSLDQVLRAGAAAVSGALRRGADAARRFSHWHHGHCPFCGWEPDFAVITPSADRRLICGRCVGAVGVRPADLPVLRQRRPRAHHLVRDARRPVPRLRVRRVPALPEGVRRPQRGASGDGGGGYDRDAAARRGSDAARVCG